MKQICGVQDFLTVNNALNFNTELCGFVSLVSLVISHMKHAIQISIVIVD